MSQLEFDESTARQLEVLYGTRDVLRRRQLVRDALGVAPGERILDVGCGPGFYVAELLEQVGSDGSVVGIDSSRPMLAVAAHRCEGHDNVSFHEADATSLPVENASFDAALSVQVLEYVADVPAALAEMYRALRAGGRLVVWDVDWATAVPAHDRSCSDGAHPAILGRAPRASIAATDPHGATPGGGVRRRQARGPHLRDQRVRSGHVWRLPRPLHRTVRGRPGRDLGRRGERLGSRAARVGAAQRVLLRLHPVLLHRDAPRLAAGVPDAARTRALRRGAKDQRPQTSPARHVSVHQTPKWTGKLPGFVAAGPLPLKVFRK